MIKIRHKIMLWVAGAGLATSLVFSIAVFLEMREQPLDLLDAQLKAMAVSLARQMSADRRFLDGEDSAVIIFASEQDWIRIYDERMRLLFQSALAGAVDLPFSSGKQDDACTVTVPIPKNIRGVPHEEGERAAFRIFAEYREVAGKLRLFQVARPVQRFDDELGDLAAAIGVGLLISTTLLFCVSYFLAGRIVRPIVLITRRAREINADTLEKRIPVGASHDEISELAFCMNQMFDRLQHSFARQKQYLSDVSHELKSPLAMLRIFFEEAARHQKDPIRFQQQLQAQEGNVRRMERLVKTMLELSLLEVRNSCNDESFNLTELLCSVVDDFAPLLEKEELLLVKELPPCLDIRGDKDALRRVMINIMDNAIKYNQPRGRIEIFAGRKGDRILVSVYNTGLGVPETELEKVFEQFYRVEKSRSLEYGGAGLGLAMVKKIVQMHGGTVKMDSMVGKWVKVTLELPVSRGLSG